VWQAGPAGSTLSQTESWSQSMRSSATRITLPDVSPFFHSRWREREKNQASPVSIVRSSASASICATISTSPLVRSVTTAVTSPFLSHLGRSSSPVSRS